MSEKRSETNARSSWLTVLASRLHKVHVGFPVCVSSRMPPGRNRSAIVRQSRAVCLGLGCSSLVCLKEPREVSMRGSPGFAPGNLGVSRVPPDTHEPCFICLALRTRLCPPSRHCPLRDARPFPARAVYTHRSSPVDITCVESFQCCLNPYVRWSFIEQPQQISALRKRTCTMTSTYH